MDYIKYRKDIDGLRALAVLLVVCFHAFPGLLKGGFIGVDIFFVISGFLISSIILENLNNNSFSFIEFYRRRIKRILPALLLVFITSYILGWFLLFSDEYEQIGKHMASGASFISNFILWKEAGYFDYAANSKPLLHLWSLGIEEQFYIIWPLLLCLLWKIKSKILLALAAIISLSFALNVLKVASFNIAVFYLPITRFWELLFGALLAYGTMKPVAQIVTLKPIISKTLAQFLGPTEEKKIQQLTANLQSCLGFFLLGLALLLINKERNFPGWWALLPTSGSFFIIAAGQEAWLNRIFLSNKIMVWIGLISFPLYLWHWPLLSFAHLTMAELLPRKIRFGIVLLSILLAWLTYRFIEKPIRFHKNKHITSLLLGSLVFIGLTGYFTYQQNGFPSRFKEAGNYVNFFKNYRLLNKIPQKYRVECDFYARGSSIPLEKHCFKSKTASAIFLWGDSHAGHLYYGLKKALPKEISILQVTSSGCNPRLVDKAALDTNYCNHSNRFALETIKKERPGLVILAQIQRHELNEDLEKIALQLKKEGIRVLVLGPLPQWNLALYKIIAKKYWNATPKRLNKHLDSAVFATDNFMQKMEEKNFDYISLTQFLCNDKGCITYLKKNKKEGLLTFDEGHLSPAGSIFVAERLRPLLLKQLAASSSAQKKRDQA